jgi:TetR/AcrR family transcriptional regulator, transcriptional repressor for nem operon
MGASNPETRNRLIQAAIELIFQRGYANVGVQELCEHAKVKKGSFYHFFASKRDLTLAALEVHWNTYRTGIEGYINAPLDPFDRVRFLFENLHKQYQSYASSNKPLTGCAFGTLSMEVSTQDTELRLALERIFIQWASLFEKVFEDAIQSGDLPKSTNASLAGNALLAYLEGVLLLVKTSQNPNLLRELSPTSAQFQAFGQL